MNAERKISQTIRYLYLKLQISVLFWIFLFIVAISIMFENREFVAIDFSKFVRMFEKREFIAIDFSKICPKCKQFQKSLFRKIKWAE